MMKRSFFLAAAGLIASMALSAPCRAGSVPVQTIAFFASTSAASTFEFQYVDSSNNPIAISDFTLVNNGGLGSLTEVIVGNDIKFSFTATTSTTGAAGPPIMPGLEFTFTATSATLPADAPVKLAAGFPILNAGTTNVTIAAQVIDLSSTPEPASLALLGIGMTGLLAFRRFFKKPTAA